MLIVLRSAYKTSVYPLTLNAVRFLFFKDFFKLFDAADSSAAEINPDVSSEFLVYQHTNNINEPR